MWETGRPPTVAQFGSLQVAAPSLMGDGSFSIEPDSPMRPTQVQRPRPSPFYSSITDKAAILSPTSHAAVELPPQHVADSIHSVMDLSRQCVMLTESLALLSSRSNAISQQLIQKESLLMAAQDVMSQQAELINKLTHSRSVSSTPLGANSPRPPVDRLEAAARPVSPNERAVPVSNDGDFSGLVRHLSESRLEVERLTKENQELAMTAAKNEAMAHAVVSNAQGLFQDSAELMKANDLLVAETRRQKEGMATLNLSISKLKEKVKKLKSLLSDAIERRGAEAQAADARVKAGREEADRLRAQVSSLLDKLVAQEDVHSAAVAEVRVAAVAAADELARREAELAAALHLAEERSVLIAALDRDIKIERERCSLQMRASEAKLAAMTSEAAALKRNAADVAAALEETRTLRAQEVAAALRAEGSRAELQGEMLKLEGEVSLLRGGVQQAEGIAAAAREEVMAAREEAAAARLEATMERGRAEGFETQLKRSQGDVASLEAEVASVRVQLGELKAAIDDVANADDPLEAHRAEAAQLRAARLDDLRAFNEQRAAFEMRLSALVAERDALVVEADGHLEANEALVAARMSDAAVQEARAAALRDEIAVLEERVRSLEGEVRALREKGIVLEEFAAEAAERASERGEALRLAEAQIQKFVDARRRKSPGDSPPREGRHVSDVIEGRDEASSAREGTDVAGGDGSEGEAPADQQKQGGGVNLQPEEPLESATEMRSEGNAKARWVRGASVASILVVIVAVVYARLFVFH